MLSVYRYMLRLCFAGSMLEPSGAKMQKLKMVLWLPLAIAFGIFGQWLGSDAGTVIIGFAVFFGIISGAIILTVSLTPGYWSAVETARNSPNRRDDGKKIIDDLYNSVLTK